MGWPVVVPAPPATRAALPAPLRTLATTTPPLPTPMEAPDRPETSSTLVRVILASSVEMEERKASYAEPWWQPSPGRGPPSPRKGRSAELLTKHVQRLKTKRLKTQGPLSDEQRHNIFQTTYKGTLQCKSSQPRGYGYMAKPSTGSERIRIQIEEQAHATAAFQQRNSELSRQSMIYKINYKLSVQTHKRLLTWSAREREQLEGKLEEERAERERFLEAERTSRLKFEKNMMAKFAEFSKQMGTQRVFMNRIDKENGNPNFQKTLLQRPSPNKATGARPTVFLQMRSYMLQQEILEGLKQLTSIATKNHGRGEVSNKRCEL
ncbi:hypothetical protein D1007_39806 [Hordeum vulgare]|nr:hypothetical protein D1007_39806 [Hordeum vulgare]